MYQLDALWKEFDANRCFLQNSLLKVSTHLAECAHQKWSNTCILISCIAIYSAEVLKTLSGNDNFCQILQLCLVFRINCALRTYGCHAMPGHCNSQLYVLRPLRTLPFCSPSEPKQLECRPEHPALLRRSKRCQKSSFTAILKGLLSTTCA